MPFLHLDHIYYDSSLQLTEMHLHRTATSLAASDHLPLIGDFHLRSWRRKRLNDPRHIGEFRDNNPGRGNGWNGKHFGEQNRLTAGGLSRFAIRDAVADHETAGEIEIEFASGPEQHSWFRFAAVASVIGWVGADIGGIDGSALLGQKFGKPICYSGGLGVSEQASANPGLVSDDYEPKALVPKLLENSGDVRQQRHPIGRRHITEVVHKYAVTVEKYSAMAHNI
jgi:hypothetical protein